MLTFNTWFVSSRVPTPPKVPLIRVIWSLLGGIWGVLECFGGVLVDKRGEK